jgi:hypothetical protein
MAILSLSVSLLAQSVWDDPAPTGRWAASTPQLASELLPPEMAADAVSHVVGRGITQGGPPFSVRFEGRPKQTNDGFCVRNSYYVSISYSDGQSGKPVVGQKLRLGGCDGIFANVNARSLMGSKNALRWLEWARNTARSRGPIPFALTCRDDLNQGKCADAREALASLPVEKTFIASKWSRKPHQWKFAITETQPGQLLWDVKVDATLGKSSVELVWMVPPPF